jgi:type IV secretion system protein VirB5
MKGKHMFKRKKQEDEDTKLEKKAGPVPFVDHREVNDDRYMNLAVEKHNWQVACRLIFGLLLISFTFNGYYMMQPKYIPYTVEIDKIGHVIAVGPADRSNPIDTKRVLRRQVIEFVENSRTVVGDNLAQKRIMNWVYARVPGNSKAKAQLDEFYRGRKPFITAQTETYSVEVTHALPLGSDNTWQVEWIESRRNLAGEIVTQERWKALLTYEVSPIDTKEGIDANPLGFFVPSFSWSKQI